MLADNPHSVSLANFPARSFMIHQKWFEFWMDRIKSNSGEILDFDRSARWENPSCMIMKIVKEKMGFLENHPVYDAHMSDRPSRWSDNRRSTSASQRNRSRPPPRYDASRSRAPSYDVGRYDAGPGPRYDAGPGPRYDAGPPIPVVHGLTGTGLSRTRLIGTTAKAGRSMVAEATALSIGHGMTTIGGLGRRVWPCMKSSTSSSSLSSSPSSSSHWNWPKKSVYVWHIFIQFVINQNHCFTLSQCMVRQCCPGPWCKIVARTIYNVCACLTVCILPLQSWLNIVVNYIIIISIISVI